MDLRHKSRAYCVSTITRLHSFPCLDQSHGIVTKHLFFGLHLFQTYVGVEMLQISNIRDVTT